MKAQLSSLVLIAALVAGTVGGVHGASVVGEVKFTDTPPRSAAVKVTKDQDYCGETLPNDSYLIDPN
jgi:hypothetical protein